MFKRIILVSNSIDDKYFLVFVLIKLEVSILHCKDLMPAKFRVYTDAITLSLLFGVGCKGLTLGVVLTFRICPFLVELHPKEDKKLKS